MLKNLVDHTDSVTSKVASISINLAVIGLSAIIITSVIDRFFGKKIRALVVKKSLKNNTMNDSAHSANKPTPEPKKPVSKKKPVKFEDIDKPTDLPMPKAESQE